MTTPLLAPDDAISIAKADQPSLVEEDRSAQVVIFGVGPVRYAIELRDDGDLRRKVTVRAHGQAVSDRFSLAMPAQCQRFADNAARKTKLAPAQIVVHLAALVDLLRERESAPDGPTVAIPASEREQAEQMLADTNLLGHITADLGTLGWIGDELARTLLYVASVSRLLPEPLWCVSRATVGATPWRGLRMIAALTPPEDLLVAHRVTNALLAKQDERGLRHRLLLIDQAETVRPDTAIALRVLHERGGIGWSTVPGAPDRRGEARGPVAVLAAAAGEIDVRCRGCFLTIGMDESPAQTARVLAEQRRRKAAGGQPAQAQDRIIARHHAMQRLLERLPVALPFAERVSFPATSLRDPADQDRFFALCQVSALLHQRQRERAEGAIMADERDFEIAKRLSAGLLGVGGEGLSRGARQLLGCLTEAGLVSVTMADLGILLPDWTRWALRAALQDLLDFGYLTSPASGRGEVRSFQLTAIGSAPRTRGGGGITLRPMSTSVLDVEVGGDRQLPLQPNLLTGR